MRRLSREIALQVAGRASPPVQLRALGTFPPRAPKRLPTNPVSEQHGTPLLQRDPHIHCAPRLRTSHPAQCRGPEPLQLPGRWLAATLHLGRRGLAGSVQSAKDRGPGARKGPLSAAAFLISELSSSIRSDAAQGCPVLRRRWLPASPPAARLARPRSPVKGGCHTKWASELYAHVIKLVLLKCGQFTPSYPSSIYPERPDCTVAQGIHPQI